MSENAQNTNNAAANLGGAVDQGANQQVNVTPDQGTDTSNGGSNAGVNINHDEANRIATERADRASKAALTNYFKQQGLTEAEASEAFKGFKEQKAQKEAEIQGNLTALQQQNAELKQQAEAALNTANQRLITADAKLQAAQLGVKPDRVDVLVRLANLSQVSVDEGGNIDSAAVKTALEEVLKQVPELKSNEANSAGFKIGGSGQNNGANNGVDLEKIFGIRKKE